MRLFVAVALPETVRADLTAALAPARSVSKAARWVEGDALHVTLQFLGHVADDRVDELSGALEPAVAEQRAFHMILRGFGAFPDAARGRVWWVGVEAAPALMSLQRAVEKALQPLGFEPEARPFHPHVTVARAARDATRAARDAIATAAAAFDYTADVAVSGVQLMRSELRRSGARYHCVRRFLLTGGS